jgi:hypothetical protein
MKYGNFDTVKKGTIKHAGSSLVIRGSVVEKSKTQRVLPFGNGWIVKGDTDKDFHVVTLTQAEAIKIAKKYSENRKGVLIIHGRNGQIKDQISYLSSDAAPTKQLSEKGSTKTSGSIARSTKKK